MDQLLHGVHNSSITRVRPFFGELCKRDPAGATWLGRLIEAAPRANILASDVRAEPGLLLPELTTARKYKDNILGPIDLPRCFEHPAPPSERFLRWLIEHPDRLAWPKRAERRLTYNEHTQTRREALTSLDAGTRAAAIAEALGELNQAGPEGSRRQWWAFEGFTEVDCWLETDRLVLFEEGKRTEALSDSTDWFPGRNQLVRNLEIVNQVRPGKAAGVLLVTQRPVNGLTEELVQQGAPHLNPAERAQLMDRYLGQTTWTALCAALDIPDELLPDTRELRQEPRRGGLDSQT